MSLKPIILKGEQKKVLFLQVTEPIQIKGVAGSGKTTVALYRAKHLLDTQSNLFQEAKVAIFTFNKTLSKYIKSLTPYITGGYNPENDEIKPQKPIGMKVTITNFHKWAYDFLETHGIPLRGKTLNGRQQSTIYETLKSKYENEESKIAKKNAEFFVEEISWIKGKLFNRKDEYIEAQRAGRGTSDRVTKIDKEVIWRIYQDYTSYLKTNSLYDFDDYALLSLKIINSAKSFVPPFTHIVVDEAQDLSKAQILVLSKIVSPETKSISIIADAAQRIYKSGFTWSEVGLNLTGGRTIVFKKNYRNTVPIINAALSLLSKENDKSDFTQVETARQGTKKPIIGYFQSGIEQYDFLEKELHVLKEGGNLQSTVILHRNHKGIQNINTFLGSKGFPHQELINQHDIDFDDDSIKVCTLSSIKGLEFDNVFIIDMNDDVIPHPEGFCEDNDEYHISTERRLLYTSITRAKERLYLLSSGTPTPYLSEIEPKFVEVLKLSNSTTIPLPEDDLPF